MWLNYKADQKYREFVQVKFKLNLYNFFTQYFVWKSSESLSQVKFEAEAEFCNSQWSFNSQ